MQLVLFSNQKGARAIRADDLDANFARLRPLRTDGPQRAYAINETPNGWTLTLFPQALNQILPELPVNTGEEIYLLASTAGGYLWVNLTDLLPSAPPESGDYVLTSQGGTQTWVALSEFFDDVLKDPDVRAELDTIIDEAIAAYLAANLDTLINTYLTGLSAGEFNSLLSTIYGETFALREVERCDGQRMKLLATDWYTP